MKLIGEALVVGTLALASIAQAEDKVDFKKQVEPILQQSCVKCHGAEKQKSELRLDSREAALKGGKHGIVIVVGDAQKSALFKRITLADDDDDAMPPKGKAPALSSAQRNLIKVWINQGAVWP